tara:strand:+ start:1401 stop:1682 length:282 start_codon:yes stop_codon:yes gene_type:complete
MTIQEIMERIGTNEIGKVLFYVKDALEEINKLSETHVTTSRIDIEEDKRFYHLPNSAIRILDIRCKNQLNDKDEYRSIPRLINEPTVKDADGS